MFSTVSCHFFAFCQTLYARFTAPPRAAIMLIIIKFMSISPHTASAFPYQQNNAGDSFFPPQSSYSSTNIPNAVFFFPAFVLKFSHITSSQDTQGWKNTTAQLLSNDPSLLLCYILLHHHHHLNEIEISKKSLQPHTQQSTMIPHRNVAQSKQLPLWMLPHERNCNQEQK